MEKRKKKRQIKHEKWSDRIWMKINTNNRNETDGGY